MSASSERRLSVRTGAPAELLVRGAHLLDPRAGLDGPGDLLVREGAIAEAGSPGGLRPPPGCEVVEAEGEHLFPGFVDPHVHLRTPGREDEEDIESGTRAAAAGGFSLILAMPNTDPPLDGAPLLRSLHEQAEAEAHVATGFLAAITRGLEGEQLTEMAELAAEGAVGFTDDGFPVASSRLVRRAFQYQRLCGGVIALHEEDPSLSGDGVVHEGQVSALLGLAGIPAISESVQIARDAAIARYEDGRCHVLHLSAAESVAALELAQAQGARITGEVTPHHLILTEDEVRSLDSRFKMNPPLRSEADRQALIDGLRSGTIAAIAADHAPHSREEKEAPFEQAPMGVTGLETAFAALYTELVLPGVLELGLVVERLTAGAALYDLPTPSLTPGAEANLCLVDTEAEWTVGEQGYESRSENSCFAERRLRGRVLLTLAAGSEAHRASQLSGRAAEAAAGAA